MNQTKIPRAASPEAVGVSSKALAELMQDVIDSKLETHSLMVLRDGQVAFETFRAPYTPDIPHVMFSVSKSITSCAIGFAIAEGRFGLDDLVIDLVPELKRDMEDPNLALLTVRHLLTMTSGKLVSIMADKAKKQWLKDYAEGVWKYAPGEGWNYSNENMYILCVIISKTCGMCVVDYLMPRLFEPLGIARPFWENDGCGVEAGGWGLYLTTEDLAKIILCYTQGGIYEGKQVIPADWVEESGKVQVQQNAPPEDLHGNQGYGYCFWRNIVPNSYRADGVFSQFGIIFPEYDACVVSTAGEVFGSHTLDCLFRHLPALFQQENLETPAPQAIPQLPAYPALGEMPRNPSLEAQLERRVITFPASIQQVPKALGFPVSVMPMAVFFMSADKAGGIDKVRIRFQENTLKFSWSEGPERNTVLCGMDGRNRKCLITLGGIEFTVACSAAWESINKLQIRIRPLNSVAERRLTFHFHGRQVYMLPRSVPSLNTMGEFAAPYALEWIPNQAIGHFVAGTIDKLAVLAEPVHLGYLR